MTTPALTMNALLELFYHYEKRVGRKPAAIDITQEQYDALRADTDTPRHLVFTNFGKTPSVFGVRINICDSAADVLKPVHPLREPRPCGANLRA